MVHSCCVVGCSNRQDKTKGISLHRIPKYPAWRREAWIRSIKRNQIDDVTGKPKKDMWYPTVSARICSNHFLEGKPSAEASHPDFIPNQKMVGVTPVKKTSVARYQRSKERLERHSDSNDTSFPESISLQKNSLNGPEFSTTGTQTSPLPEVYTLKELQNEKKDHLKDIHYLTQRLQRTEQKLQNTKVSLDNLDDSQIVFYTGLPRGIFNWIFEQVKYAVAKKQFAKYLSLKDHLLLVLTKIRLGLLNKDLSIRCLISESTVSRVWNVWVPILSNYLKSAIIWPERDVARSNVPYSFKPDYRKCISIIDCFEIFTERSTNLTARAQTWSNYKHNNTVKFLISITAAGAVSFISKGLGRASFRQTNHT